MTSGIDPEANARTIVSALDTAAGEGAAMLFTPEMSGLLDRDRKRALGQVRPEGGDRVLAAVGLATAEYGYNAAWLDFGPAGNAPAGGWWQCFVYYMGVWVLMMFTFVPPGFAGVEPDVAALAPRPGAPLPLDARFVDEHGRAVQLGDYFGERPVIVVLGYYGCSNLCAVVLNGLEASVATTGLTAGRDFDVVVASIDPREGQVVARIMVGHAPSDVGVMDGAVWVTTQRAPAM